MDKTKKCPDFQTLSSFFDRELGQDEEFSISEHIKACSKCQDKVKGYRKIRETVNESNVDMPEGLIERLKINVRKIIQEPEITINSNFLDDESLEGLSAAGAKMEEQTDIKKDTH